MEHKELKNRLKKIQMFVLDMDGTIYLGDRLFSFTKDFLDNSSKNREAYLQKLHSMGISVTPEQMLLSNDVILEWLKENRPGESCYVVGTPFLLEDFRHAGISIQEANPDYVVLGFDTTLTYEKLSLACSLIQRGKPVYGVNPDLNCPTENGFIPDCGSIAALVKASTGVDCEFFGKPSRHTLSYLLKRTGCRPEELAIIGDRLDTDIAVADQTAVTSILVMSGETTPELLAASEVKPDFVLNDLEELGELLS